MLSMRDSGFRVTATGSGDPAPFTRAGIDFRPFPFHRFMSPSSDWNAVNRLTAILRELRPDLAQAYDSKPCLFLPLAARAANQPAVIRTICGRGWLYSSHSPVALAVRPVYRAMYRATSRWTSATVFETEDDRTFFENHRLTGKNDLVIPAGGGGVDVEGFERAFAGSPPPRQLREELVPGIRAE